MAESVLSDLVDQVTTKATGVKPDGSRYVGLEDIDPGSNKISSFSSSSVSTSTNGVFSEGDILFGKLRPNLRKSAVAEFAGYCSTDFIIMRARPGVDARYAGHVASSDAVFSHAERNSIGTGMPRTSWRAVSLSPVHVPPIDEQLRIAEVLDTIDDNIRATERIVKKLRAFRHGLLLSVHDRYFPGGGPVALRAQRSPVECSLLTELIHDGDVQLGRGMVISAIDIGNDPGPYPIYSSSASATGEFGRYGKFMFHEELITWSVDGGGRPFYRPRHRFSITNVGGFLRIQRRQNWSYRFVHILMEVQHSMLTFDWLMKAHPSVIRDLYWLPRIPLDEQHEVTRRLDDCDDLLRRELAELAKLELLRHGLAADLLSGLVRTVAA